MSTKPKTYTIRTLDDLAEIPDDRLEACLSELAQGIRRTRAATELARAAAPAILRPFIKTQCARMIWIDDGKRNQTVRINGNVVFEETDD